MMVCEKCGAGSGDDWSQCRGSCPLPISPHYQPSAALTGDDNGPYWIYEDELPDDYPYDAMFPYSKVDGVRLFPALPDRH